MEYFGYAGKTLNIDLGTKRIWEEELADEIIDNFIGGLGASFKIFYELHKPGIDPFAPENPLVIGCGPFVGTFLPGSAKTVAITKLPLTMTIGYAVAGMNLGHRLKYAGYDGVNVTDSSNSPVYIKIFDDSVEICDATFLWGRDIYETTNWFWDNFGTDCSVLAIGQAGENRVRMATALVDQVSSLGKGGLGAVMGSKNLKAIVVKGTKGLKVADSKRLRAFVDGLMRELKKASFTHELWEYGRMTVWDLRTLGFLYKNYTELFPSDKAKGLFGLEVYMSKVRKGRLACMSCPLGEKEVLKVREGDFQGLFTYISNWPGRTRDFGIRLALSSYNQNAKCIELMNRYGLCSHTTSAIIELAIDLYNKGIISKRDTNGMDLRLGFDTAIKLIEQIASRQGFGEILAEGFLGIIKKYGKEAEKHAVIVKGMDPQVDPRTGCLGPWEFEQIVNPRGARLQAASVSQVIGSIYRSEVDALKRFCKGIGVSEDELKSIFNEGECNIGRLTRHAEDWYVILTSLGICQESPTLEESPIKKYFDLQGIAELYLWITGIEKSPGQLKKAGERGWNLFKIMNVLEGFDRKDDRIPQKWLEPLSEKMKLKDVLKRPLTRGDVESMLDDYYRERGWDVGTGIPSEQKCKELGFDESLIRRLG